MTDGEIRTDSMQITDKSAADSAYGFLMQLDRVFLWLLLSTQQGENCDYTHHRNP